MTKAKIDGFGQEAMAEMVMQSLKRENPRVMNDCQVALLNAVVRFQEKGSCLLDNK
jgi:hypothetical protein